MSTAIRHAVLFALVVIGTVVNEVNGKPPNRIRGGTKAAPDQHPWIVAIGDGLDDPQPDCGGAIISPRHILTAAHCVADKKPNDLIIRAGFIKIHDKNPVVRHVSVIHTHPDYQPETEKISVSDDIAVLVLKMDLPIDGQSIKIVSLPSKQPGNQYAVFAGWGFLTEDSNESTFPSTLQTAVVRVEDAATCEAANNEIVLPQFICGYIKNGNTFSGDSGSPLVSNGEIIGLLSSSSGERDAADFYVNVYQYLTWIHLQMD